MLRALCLCLLTGCSLFSVRRTGFGLTGSTEGSIAISASAEIGGGSLDAPHEITADRTRHGEAVSWFVGGGASTRGAELETGGRVDYVLLRGNRAVRIGGRSGVVARSDAPLLAYDAVLALGAPLSWRPRRMQYLGVELRAGVALAIDRNDLRWHAARFYAGIFHDRFAVARRRYDPFDVLLPDPKSTN